MINHPNNPALDPVDEEFEDIELSRFEIYRGNPNLKRPGIVVDFTPEQQAELLMCAADCVYFTRKYMKIVNVDEGLIAFDLRDYQEELISTVMNNRFTICKMARQTGKALDIETPILTPSGFKKLADIKVGDVIYGPDGKETTVTFATEVMHNHKVYLVQFDNGDTVLADEDHLWEVGCQNWRRTNKTKVMTTKEMIPFVENSLVNNKRHKLFIKFTQPLDTNTPVEWNPWLVGLWLGDGDSASARITAHIDDFKKYKHRLGTLSGVGYDNRNPNVTYFNCVDLRPSLVALGLLGNKHIPQEILFAPMEQKIDFLRGLMDSDGHCGTDGVVEFYQKSESFINDFRTLLSSMGVKSRKRSKEIKGETHFTVSFATDLFNPFSLKRKAERFSPQTHIKNKRLYIHGITETDSVPVRCIQVSNDDHLFLCGPTLIPTHNTTAVVAILLWHALFSENYSIAILAHKASQSREILARLQFAYEYLPIWMQQGVVEWNKGKIELENGSKIIAGATSSSSVRGGTYNMLYLDEFAFVPGNIQQEFFASVYPTISSGKTTKIVITSTPNGLDLFFQIWRNSEEGKNSYKRINVHWSKVPGRDEAWKQETINNTSVQQFRQEHEVEFIGSSKTLIDGQTLSTLPYNDAEKISENGTMMIFEEPSKFRRYVMTVDVARGVGGDNSAFVVFDVSHIPYRVVCTFYDNMIPSITFPNVIYQIAQKYNNAHVLVEINDIGGEVANILHWDYEYENLLMTQTEKRTGQIVGAGFGNGSSQLGFRMTTSTKRIGCQYLKTIVEKSKLDIRDFRIIKELSNFVEKGASYAADDGYHDDLAMCLVSFAWFSTQMYFQQLMESNVKLSVLEDTRDFIDDSMIPFGFVSDGINDYDRDQEIMDDEEELMRSTTSPEAQRILAKYRL